AMPRRPTWLALTAAGLSMVWIGDASPAGAGAAAGAGFAMAAVGCAGLTSSLLPADLLRREVLSVLATVISVTGFTASGVVAAPSEAASVREQASVRALAERLPAPPSGSTILFEESCAAPVFGSSASSSRELAAMLGITYPDRALTAVILTPRVAVGPKALRVVSAGGAATSHAYGSQLFV